MRLIHVPFLSRWQGPAQLLQKLNHVIKAVGLAAAGARGPAEGARGADLVLASVEIVTTVLLAVVNRTDAPNKPAAGDSPRLRTPGQMLPVESAAWRHRSSSASPVSGSIRRVT